MRQSYDPWALVHNVMAQLAGEGLRPSIAGEDIGEVKRAAEALLRAMQIEPASSPD